MLQSQDNVFFEEYKRLDKLCSKMFACNNGVTEYITQMENKSSIGYLRIISWESDYKMLKRIRYVRNKIAHEPNWLQFSNYEDLLNVRSFYKRILSGQDPLTVLNKKLRAELAKKNARRARTSSSHARSQEKIIGYSLVGFLFGLAVLLIVVLITIYFG